MVVPLEKFNGITIVKFNGVTIVKFFIPGVGRIGGGSLSLLAAIVGVGGPLPPGRIARPFGAAQFQLCIRLHIRVKDLIETEKSD